MDQLIKEMEVIIYSGTKLNIDYSLDDLLDEDQQEDIYEYFMEAESDNIQEALDEFDGEYDEEGNELKAPTYDSKYSIDVVWENEEPEGWKSKKIKLDGAKNRHTFFGLEYEDEI